MRSLSVEAGMATSSLCAELALRLRVSISAIGSVMTMRSPRGLRHARNLALVGKLTETDAAQLEPAEDGSLPAATLTARVGPHAELLHRPLLLFDQCFLRHTSPL